MFKMSAQNIYPEGNGKNFTWNLARLTFGLNVPKFTVNNLKTYLDFPGRILPFPSG